MKKQTRREFVRILFTAGQAAVASQFLPASLFAEGNAAASHSDFPPDALNFILFGDWGRRGQIDQLNVAAQMASASSAIDAKFVVSVGDNFYETGVGSTEDSHWRESFEEVYKASALQIPWNVILGNHDYYGNCDAQIAYGKTSRRWKMPARYFVETRQLGSGVTADFFYVDTTPMVKIYYEVKEETMRANVRAQDVPAQVAWLKSALAASKAQWKIVIGHHPIYSGNARGGTPELVDLILPILYDYKVQAYFNGHDHDLQHLVTRNLNLFCSGAGSIVSPKTLETERTKFVRNCPGFIAASLQRDKLNVHMIDGSGSVLHTAVVPRVAT
jgi:tartrate-resistant acid phosphatase type 5